MIDLHEIFDETETGQTAEGEVTETRAGDYDPRNKEAWLDALLMAWEPTCEDARSKLGSRKE